MMKSRLKRMLRRGGGGGGHGMPALIPMIDMLTIMVVYLLVHAADYEILPNTKNIAIPMSFAEVAPRQTVTVLVTKDALFVNGAQVMTVAALTAAPEAVVEPLRGVLAAESKRIASESVGTAAAAATRTEVTVMADKGLPYATLKKIMSTCSAAEFAKLSLAVVEREDAYKGPAT
jgi:biopolymer transport protein TolR